MLACRFTFFSFFTTLSKLVPRIYMGSSIGILYGVDYKWREPDRDLAGISVRADD